MRESVRSHEIVDCSVLVLNSLYQAVQITGTHRAFRLFYAGRARALSPDFTPYDFDNWCDLPVGIDDDVIRTPSRRIRIPRPTPRDGRGAALTLRALG